MNPYVLSLQISNGTSGINAKEKKKIIIIIGTGKKSRKFYESFSVNLPILLALTAKVIMSSVGPSYSYKFLGLYVK